MGDKRYYYNIFDDGTEYIEDYWGNKHYFNLDDVEELLNEQQSIIEDKSNVIILMGAFIKSKGFSVDDFNEWISKDWHHVGDDL